MAARTKKKANPKGKYIIHSRHTELIPEQQIMVVIAFDPGSANPAVRIEKRIASSISKHCSTIETVNQSCVKIEYQRSGVNKTKGSPTISHCTTGIIDLLNDMTSDCGDIDLVLIEGQMDINRPMMHFQYTVITYFLIKYPNTCVVEVSSKLKAKAFDVKCTSRNELKEWSIDNAIKLATKRNDKKFIAYIEPLIKNNLKVDDHCDAYNMIEAFCIEVGYHITKI
jgi:hypothetical protein